MFFSGSITKVKYKTTLSGNSFLPSGKGVYKSQQWLLGIYKAVQIYRPYRVKVAVVL